MRIGSREWSDLIIEGAAALDLDLNSSHTRQFAIHARELVRWNQKFNISAITDPLEMAVKHYLDSLSVVRFLPPDAVLLDIGSGGGFPGLPLKVYLPRLSVTLIDASRKRVNFLKQVIRALNLDQIEALHIRAEMLAANQRYCNRFDVVTSRALSSLNSICELARPFMADNSVILALKGEVGCEELRTIQDRKIAGGGHSRFDDHPFAVTVNHFRLPVLDLHRSVVVIRKTG